MDSGKILYQNNSNEKKMIASTTKKMTYVIIYEYGKDFFGTMKEDLILQYCYIIIVII